jgi:hypothetical protein
LHFEAGAEFAVPKTALQHFQEDIGRARAIVGHAVDAPQGDAAARLLRSDLLRSAWMFAVGALDAYFCDAYTDLIAATAISKEPAGEGRAARMGIRHQSTDPSDSRRIRQPELAMENGGAKDDGL